jgi:pyruvate dehydrogenase E2 component (dihydrolipoamide acetyltransferase)
MRRAIIRTVAASAQLPQFSVETAVSAGAATALRRRLNDDGQPVSLTDVLHAAVARTLVHHPLLNASWTETAVLQHHRVHLAFIVEVDDGMVTPVIRDADRLGLMDLARERRSLTARSTGGGLSPSDLVDGTFTVSNLGPFGVRRFTALVLPPQSAVLGVGAADEHEQIALTLSVDHRVVDGATAARFLRDLGARIEDPTSLVPPASDVVGSTP